MRLNKIFKIILVVVLIFGWFYNYPPINFGGQGWLQLWKNPPIPPKIQTTQAADGSGINTVDPNTATAGSTGNTFTFTFTAAETMDSGELSILLELKANHQKKLLSKLPRQLLLK